MDKLPAPPNGSPEEIQAWNNMMDTMVTFIKASTHLMNTITEKVRYKAKSGPAPGAKEGCEPECEVCQPKPPCGVCGKAKHIGLSPVAPTPATPAPTEDAPDTEAPPDPPPPDDAPPIEDEDSEPPADQNEADASPDTPASPEDADTMQSPEATSTPAPKAVSGEGQCICATIRAQKRAAEKKDRCSCSKKKQNLSNVTEEPSSEAPDMEVEILCGCGATPGNTEAMMKDMMGKLANAQEEINQLQEELAKLQRMDASKRTGPHAGPNPAALYREIMKDTSGMRGPYEPVCVPCGDDTPRTSPGSYMGTPDMTLPSRPTLRQTAMPQFVSGRSTPFYAAPQPPCRRPGPRYMGQSPSLTSSPMYGRSPQNPQDYDNAPNPEYWSRMAEYAPNPNLQVQRIMCPSMRTPTSETPPKRTIICSPSRPSGPSSCSSNSCRIQDPNMS